MKYLKRFNESETIGEYPDRFTLTMKESPERAIKLIDESTNFKR
jgi:hypothetical protein